MLKFLKLFVIILFLNQSSAKADFVKPNSDIEPDEVIKIQLKSLMKNDVPSKDNEIVNDERIRAAIPTINYILSKNAKVSIISHFGRPNEGKFDEKYSLRIVAERMAKILNRSVHFEEIPLDQKSPEYTHDITVHENTRFLVGEKSGDEDLARKIAKNCAKSF